MIFGSFPQIQVGLLGYMNLGIHESYERKNFPTENIHNRKYPTELLGYMNLGIHESCERSLSIKQIFYVLSIKQVSHKISIKKSI
jgi:hypothetical protein